MANRFDERVEFRNRGRSEWDDDHGNGSGHGRAYGRARFDEDNDQGRLGTQGYYDDRFNDRASASRSGRFDQDWSDRGPYAEQHNGDLGSNGSMAGSHDRGFGMYGGRDSGRGFGWRNERDYGPQRRHGGFAGGSMGYGANRDFRADRSRGYGGADMNFGDRHYPEWTGDSAERSHDDGRFGQGGMTGTTGAGINRDHGGYGPYSTDWAESGQMAGQSGISHHDQDYAHWRHQQMGKLDRDYLDWRAERRRKFSEDFESWRASRPQNPNDEHLANANPKNPSSVGAMGNTNPATGSSPSGSSRQK